MCLLGFGYAPVESAGQDHPGELEGFVRAEQSGQPLAGARVTIVGTPQFVITSSDGSFHLRVADGQYTVRVERLGYAALDTTISVRAQVDPLVIELQESALELEGLVITGSISERGSDQVLRPVNVLSADELQRRLQPTVAATLGSEPGITVTSMGPATARPVIRGMSGDRLLVLEDGARVMDVSNAGPDHATALDPTSARRIEVVRGPGAILYGSNAIGGVINVIRDEIPITVPHDATGSVTLQGQSVTSGLGGAANLLVPLTERIRFRVELARRSSGDLGTPVGDLANTGSDSWTLGAGTSWVGDRGHIGVSALGHANDYGIPGGFVGGHHAGVTIESERASLKAAGEHRPSEGSFSSLSANASYSYYELVEIEPPDILGTRFQRQAAMSNLLARHEKLGPFSLGAFGARASWESFQFGGSLFTPDAERLSVGVFSFEEIDLDPIRVEAGIRYDWTRTEPAYEDPASDIGHVRQRGFGSFSGSFGLLYNARAGLTLGASVSRAFRTPDVNELFSEGPHLAAYAFEVGNPSLEEEIGTGIDVFSRFHGESFHAELTGFMNLINGYVFSRDTGELSRTRLPIYQFFGENARFVGFEAALDWVLSGPLKLEGVASYVRGEIRATGEPLPLIPPLQAGATIAYEPTDWFIRAESHFAAKQGRVGEFETTTDGYVRFDLWAGLSRTIGGRLNVLTVGLENVTDQEYRNHLSRVKEIMPEAGRGITLTYRVVF